jgi:glycogen synthase
MRIFLTADTEGGVWDYAVTLTRALHAGGHEVLLAVLGEPRDERLARIPAGVEVAWRDYRLEWMAEAGADVAAAGAWLSRISHLWAADVVHLNQMAYAAHGFSAPTLTVVHSDVLSWVRRVENRHAGAEWGRYAGWVRAGLLASDRVVAPTAYQASLLERSYGRAADQVIHNGVEAPGPQPPPVREPLVLTVGRAWDPGKGIDVVDEAAERLGSEAPEVRHLGRLEGPGGASYLPRALISSGPVGRREVDAWMARAGVYVAASRYEPFGLAPVEAALRGCALVLSDIGSFRELWEGCAVFFPPADAGGLAEALRSLSRDPERREALAMAARTRALRRYTAERMARRYLEVYAALTAGGPLAEGARRIAAGS